MVTRAALQQLAGALTAHHKPGRPAKSAWWQRRRAAVEAALRELGEAP